MILLRTYVCPFRQALNALAAGSLLLARYAGLPSRREGGGYNSKTCEHNYAWGLSPGATQLGPDWEPSSPRSLEPRRAVAPLRLASFGPLIARVLTVSQGRPAGAAP